jgi:carboxylesterase
LDSVSAGAQIFCLQQTVRRSLPELRAPLLIFQGKLDQSVLLEGTLEVQAKAGSADRKVIWLEKSTHCLLLDVERDAVAAETHRFMERLKVAK